MSFVNFPPNNPATLTDTEVYGPVSLNPFINGLMSGSKWGFKPPEDLATPTTLDYWFFNDELLPAGSITQENRGSIWLTEEVIAAVRAMNSFAEVANIVFVPAASFNDANISWASLNGAQTGGLAGYGVFPYFEFGIQAGVIGMNWELYNDNLAFGSLDSGSIHSLTFIHELGHALGLKHTHDILGTFGQYLPFPGVSPGVVLDAGDNGLNAGPWSVMTYNNDTAFNGYYPTSPSFSGFLMGPGAFDIAAIQYLYGPNIRHATGNNTYQLDSGTLNGWYSIWDNGGIDTITATLSDAAVNIDLRNATLNNSFGGGGYPSQIGGQYRGYTIAYDSTGNCIIENALGSPYADILRGNKSNNRLDGSSGIDEAVFGGAINEYTFSILDNELIVIDATPSRDGMDTLINIETLVFQGVPYSLEAVLARVNSTPAPPTSPGPTTPPSSGPTTPPSTSTPSAESPKENPDTNDARDGEFKPSVIGNSITGNDQANDICPESAGRFIMTGKRGADRFCFSVPEKKNIQNADLIIDFSSAEGDLLSLSENIFESLENGVSVKTVYGKKALKKAQFANERVVYRRDLGQIYLNGNGASIGWGREGGIFAVLEGMPSLTSSDFEIV